MLPWMQWRDRWPLVRRKTLLQARAQGDDLLVRLLSYEGTLETLYSRIEALEHQLTATRITLEEQESDNRKLRTTVRRLVREQASGHK